MKRMLAAAVTAALFSAVSAAALPAPPPYKLASLNAYLFYNDSGGFSPAVPERAPLWNTIIGEGWAKHSSDATLVRVEVSGQPGSYSLTRTVRLVVRKGDLVKSGTYRWGAVFETSADDLTVLTAAGRTTVAFWIPKTGCVPLRLTATLLGQKPPSVLTRIVPFACGD